MRQPDGIPDDGWREAIELYPSSSSSVHQLVVPIEEIVSPRAQASKARHVLSVFQRIQTRNASNHGTMLSCTPANTPYKHTAATGIMSTHRNFVF